MVQRAIVRDISILSGRWRLEGTTVPIADIRASLKGVSDDRGDLLRYLDLTDAEVQAIRDFDFPSVRTARPDYEHGEVTVACSCGEVSAQSTAGQRVDVLTCACGREWNVRVVIEQATAVVLR